jgi:hypothetical protein
MKPPSKTDWNRVKREVETDTPITVDLASELYDPNDEAAVLVH